jgi:hypothetical protein
MASGWSDCCLDGREVNASYSSIALRTAFIVTNPVRPVHPVDVTGVLGATGRTGHRAFLVRVIAKTRTHIEPAHVRSAPGRGAQLDGLRGRMTESTSEDLVVKDTCGASRTHPSCRLSRRMEPLRTCLCGVGRSLRCWSSKPVRRVGLPYSAP